MRAASRTRPREPAPGRRCGFHRADYSPQKQRGGCYCDNPILLERKDLSNPKKAVEKMSVCPKTPPHHPELNDKRRQRANNLQGAEVHAASTRPCREDPCLPGSSRSPSLTNTTTYCRLLFQIIVTTHVYCANSAKRRKKEKLTATLSPDMTSCTLRWESFQTFFCPQTPIPLSFTQPNTTHRL